MKNKITSFVIALLTCASLAGFGQVGTWPAYPGYLYFGANELNQSIIGNYALLQDKTTGQTFLNSPASLYFRINNIDKMYLSNSGNFGIGTLIPETRLHIVSTLNTAGANTATFSASNIGPNISYIHWGNTGDWYLRSSTSTGKVVLQDTGGSIGIGTAAPLHKLSVKGGVGDSNSGVIAIDANGAMASLRLGVNIDYSWIQAHGSRPLRINELGNNTLLNTSGGNVGIGITSPAYKLEVSGGAIALDAEQPLRGGGKWLISGNSSMVTVGTANPGVGLRFYAGADINRMIIDPATGNVGIGSQSPTQKLTVNGTIYGKEVKVDLSVPCPDYVFEEDYKLTSLEDIKTYIDKNKRLPEVPSAKEMEKNGIRLGEMNMLLLKKIEELTLHMIEQETKMKKMESEIQVLKNQK